MYSVRIDDFEKFMHRTARSIIDSNNNIEILNKALNDYNEIKSKVDPNDILNMSGDFINFDKRFEKVIELGFERVEERKKTQNDIPF